MTEAELAQIQTACRVWLQQPGTVGNSRLTIPCSVSLSRPVQIEIKALLTFDDVLITAAVDAETGAKYTSLIRRPGEPDEYFDTPLEIIATVPQTASSESTTPTPLRPTQRRYQEAMDQLAERERQRDRGNDFDPLAGYSPWLDESPLATHDLLPKYLVYTGAVLLGYTLFERVHSARERSGRFYPNDDYFAYADIFAALPDAEEEYYETAARKAYGLGADGSDETWQRFNELSAQVEALAIYLQTEDGQRMEVAEIRVMDLSRKYDDQAERWLYITQEEQKVSADLPQP